MNWTTPQWKFDGENRERVVERIKIHGGIAIPTALVSQLMLFTEETLSIDSICAQTVFTFYKLVVRLFVISTNLFFR